MKSYKAGFADIELIIDLYSIYYRQSKDFLHSDLAYKVTIEVTQLFMYRNHKL